MRAAKELSILPPYEEYEAIDSLPRIEVEFFHLKNNDDSDHGRLSILDTPGPNEFGQSDALKKVFRKQLAQASAVLLVMDYTQLNSKADDEVRKDIASMQESLGERLFTLVNKFDNASKNTMDTEATKKYVSEHLLENIPSERVFPVSSWQAYLANRALNELDHQGKINEDDDWVEDFGRKH
jgi:GTPase Era involved in 16S rRNA processing